MLKCVVQLKGIDVIDQTKLKSMKMKILTRNIVLTFDSKFILVYCVRISISSIQTHIQNCF